MSTISKEQHQNLEALIKKAGNELLRYWHAKDDKNESLGVQQKADGSSVTNADFASNQILVEGLIKAFPECSILSEELPITDEITAKDKIWIIDPLDGTRSFIEGRDDFSILIGLSVNKAIEYGIMYFPVRDILAFASKGQGAFVNGKKSETSKNSKLRLNSVYYRNFQPKDSPSLFHEKIDSGLAFLQLASGALDAVVMRMTTHKEWDLAAPAALILEGGGKITDEKGQALKFGTGEVYYEYLVASNGNAHKEALEVIY